MSRESLIASLRTVPDYPKKGILFWDVTTLFKDPKAFKEVEDILYEEYKDKGITKVAGIESRGFVMGAALASRLGAGFVLIRKPGKLPADTVKMSYELEYIKGEVWANVYGTDQIVRIDPDTGVVRGVINLRNILPQGLRRPRTDVLNGIAFDARSGAVYVTGKYWPKLYRITLQEKKQ